MKPISDHDAALMRTVVIGGDSLIGAAWLARAESRGLAPARTSRRGHQGALMLDLEAAWSLPWDQWRRAGYRHALIAAAMTGLSACEQAEDRSLRLNQTEPLRLAAAAVAAGIVPILLSSDYVFDGRRGGYRETDPINPLNVYGQHKAGLEAGVAGCLEQTLLVRLSKVFTLNLTDSNLLASIALPLSRREPIRAADDLVFSPILLDEVIDGLQALIGLDYRGLIHLGGREVWSRWELAQALAAGLGLDQGLIQRIQVSDLVEPFVRPCRTDLDSRQLQTLTGLPRSSLAELIAGLCGPWSEAQRATIKAP